MLDASALVLVVDDNDASRFHRCQLLKRAGFAVIEATTGAGALDQARRFPVDVVLLDVNLPDINGVEVCGRMKADAALAAVQVLQISATATTDEDRIRGLAGGADAYVVEPIDPDVLLATLRALLRVRRAEQERMAALAREREAREEAEEANRAKDAFLAALSHELRTPLNAMIGWIRLLQDGRLDADRQQRAVEALERSAKQQWRLINELLDAASIRQRKLRVEPSDVDLAAIGAAVVELVKPEAERKRIELKVAMQPTAAYADAARIQQVITNLLNNALQFTSPGGEVSLTIGSAGREMPTIEVADTGVGIAPDFLPHIFDEFRQADPSRKDHAGLGLGLAISRHIVELHGGRIAAHSDGLGRGARFTVRIPRAGNAAS